jgi:hypothetical protein
MDAALRKLVRERAADCCEYCLLPQACLPHLRFHTDHIIAEQHRGDDDAENLALACDHCNYHKGTNIASIDPDTGNLVRLFNPRADNWREHFTLVGPEIVGQTEIGRATVELLKINADSRLELRAAAIARNEFPRPDET